MTNDFNAWDAVTQSWLQESARVEQALFRHSQRERTIDYRRESNWTILLAVGVGLICAALLLFGGL